jgi:hypothetical protein
MVSSISPLKISDGSRKVLAYKKKSIEIYTKVINQLQDIL